MNNQYNSKWQITIHFRNATHQTIETLELPVLNLNGTEQIRSTIDEYMIPKLEEMQWTGFGLWSQHEPIKDDTIFDDLNYQRDGFGEILFECEDHACRYRAITTKVKKYDECIVCFEKNDNFKSVMMCMHMCCCKKCFDKIKNCPICRKPKTK